MVPLPRLELGSVNLHPPTQAPPSGSSHHEISHNSDQVEEHLQAGHQVTDHHNFRCLLSPNNPHKLLSNSTLSPSTKCHSTSIPERISRRRSQGRQRPRRGRSLSATESAAARRLSSLSRWVPSNAEIATFLRLSRSSSTFTTMLADSFPRRRRSSGRDWFLGATTQRRPQSHEA